MERNFHDGVGGIREVRNNVFHKEAGVCFVCWLLNVPATGYCISGTDLLRQFYVMQQ